MKITLFRPIRWARFLAFLATFALDSRSLHNNHVLRSLGRDKTCPRRVRERVEQRINF